MKYLEKFQSDQYTDIIDRYRKLMREVSDVKEVINELIASYVNINKNKWEKWGIHGTGNDLICANFRLYSDSMTIDVYEDGFSDWNDIDLSDDDYQDFLKFSKDPDLYKQTKKYNL